MATNKSSEVTDRMKALGFNNDDVKIICCAIFEGNINPQNWTFLADDFLRESLKEKLAAIAPNYNGFLFYFIALNKFLIRFYYYF